MTNVIVILLTIIAISTIIVSRSISKWRSEVLKLNEQLTEIKKQNETHTFQLGRLLTLFEDHKVHTEFALEDIKRELDTD